MENKINWREKFGSCKQGYLEIISSQIGPLGIPSCKKRSRSKNERYAEGHCPCEEYSGN